VGIGCYGSTVTFKCLALTLLMARIALAHNINIALATDYFALGALDLYR